jgi:hypothetical protein
LFRKYFGTEAATFAHCYWRLRRATRFESEATIAELLAQARYEDAEVPQQIEELLGVAIEVHEGENGDSLSREWASPTWWQQILSGPDELVQRIIDFQSDYLVS